MVSIYTVKDNNVNPTKDKKVIMGHYNPKANDDAQMHEAFHFSTKQIGQKLGLNESQIGKIVTEETRKRQSLAKLGRTFSKETKDKMSKSRMGSKRSIEVKKKMSEIRKGIEFTQEHCDNISKSKSGVKFHTGHSRAAISESLKGNQSRLGIKHSDEAKKKKV